MKNTNILEISERTIDLLQSLDATFSQINKTLRDLNAKILELDKKNNQNIKKIEPWSQFFGIDKILNQNKQSEINTSICHQKIISSNDNDTIEEINNQKKVVYDTSSENDLNFPQLRLKNLYHSESFCASAENSPQLEHFDYSVVPIQISKSCDDQFSQKILELVKYKQLISLDAIYHSFENTTTEIIDEVLQKLIQNRYIGCRDGNFYVK